MAKKGDWVRLSAVILAPGQRAPQVPEDTARVPLVQWVKGWLEEDAGIGKTARVRTRTGRLVEGTLVEEAPAFSHSFGSFIPELLTVQQGIKEALWGREGQP